MFFSVVAGAPPLAVSWVIALLPWLIYAPVSGRTVSRNPFNIPVLLFCLGLTLGFLVSPDKGVAGEAFATMFAGVLIYYGLVNNAGRGRVYWAAMSGFACLIVLGLTVWFFSQGNNRIMDFNRWLFALETDMPKIDSPVMQFNNLGFFLAVTAPVFLAIGLFSTSRKRWFSIGAAIVLLAAVFLSASGSGWGGAACSIVFVLAIWRWRSLFVTVPVFVTTGIVAAINYRRFDWINTVFSVESLKSRVDVWIKTFPPLEKSWLTGLGLGNWPILFDSWPNVHNGYIQLYADTGLFGVAAMVYAAVVFVMIAFRILRSPKRGAWYAIGVGFIAAFLGGAAASIFEVAMTGTFFKPEMHYIGIPLLWIMAAFLVIAHRRLTEYQVTNTKQ